ncbi:MAG: hypothetical protein CMJ83_04995 [Planctomycetes bacterium]|nr:hypothetical protein [Planctomycetota bacterium]
MVHDRRCGERVLDLEMSGAVKRGNLIMYDRETDTRWLQENGHALEGKLKGEVLKALDSEHVEKKISWGKWKARHPKSRVLWCGHCFNDGK